MSGAAAEAEASFEELVLAGGRRNTLEGDGGRSGDKTGEQPVVLSFDSVN